MTETQFTEEAKKHGYRIRGEFENQFGERYVVYTHPRFPFIQYVTGDELEWEMGWTYMGKGVLAQHFQLSHAEDVKLNKILGNLSVDN